MRSQPRVRQAKAKASATVPVDLTIKVLGRPAGLGERVIDLDTIEFADGRVIAASLALRLQPGGVNR